MNLYHLLIAIPLLALISAGPAAEPVTSPTNKLDCCAKELPAVTPLSDRSLYQLDSSWTNDAGATLKLAALRGRPQVVTMFFASCQFTCPVLVKDMQRIEAALPENLRTNVGFVLVSFDSDRDTPEALAAYRKAHGLPFNWTLLRGAPEEVLELGALLGIKYKKDLRGQFAHSNVITVLDGGGETVRQIVGLNRDAGEAIEAIEQALPSKGKKGKTTKTN
jgi:protein SCO1